MAMIRRWFAFSLVCLCLFGAGCGYEGPRYVVTGGVDSFEPNPDMSGATCRVLLDGQRVTDALVTIDGIAASLNAFDAYEVAGLSPQPGDEVAFEVTLGDFWAGASVTMPSMPILTAPTGTHDSSQPITVEWTSGSFPAERVQVSVGSSDTVSGFQWTVFVDSTATSAEIPGGTVKPGVAGATAFIVSTNTVSDVGPWAGEGSYVQATCVPNPIVFSTQ